ncbi:uncharacterized protein NDAI_0B04300 [Naumovozyma dairenensis CBS 421]|uniref:Glycosyltransferase family 91 protein n=1 Tax=Naumovozyma dairenensis (strain ATCC 10597 / BCRC 20456 / CBS 421 / NBRC 0211 / NRRL Y-12639) TaxID=1071378 RepID=G0W6Q3_NAUDC|nr:hypothetical protein NDAI_0B04300 [Naumovozyma dairenensis CBS 421]CCD23464.1 hypothetical protein NDAI_0B04300 [Naumovozyma dairenensis CBS 421]
MDFKQDYELRDINFDESRSTSPNLRDVPASHYNNTSKFKRFFGLIFRKMLGGSIKTIILRLITLALSIYVIAIISHPSTRTVTIQWIQDNTNSLAQEVASADQIIDANIAPYFKFKKWNKSPVTNVTLSHKYIDYNTTGFVWNLNVQPATKNEEEISSVSDFNVLNHDSYEKSTNCSSLQYTNTIKYSNWTKYIGDDLVEFRRELLALKNDLTKEVTSDDGASEKKKDPKAPDLSEEEIVKKYWSKFGAAAAWLESEQCYVVYSRVMYWHSGVKKMPHTSLVRAQAFDRNWNEIKGKQIPYIDVKAPSSLEKELASLDKELNLADCDAFLDVNPEAYDDCKVSNAKGTLNAKKRRENILTKHFITYPTMLDVPFNSKVDWAGPEDPRVITRKIDGIDEPIVVFNLPIDDKNQRRMYGIFPHRRVNNIIEFKVPDHKMRYAEKNWTPFFEQSNQASGTSSFSRGSINFIYSFFPMEIFKCSLDDGICEVVFEGKDLGLSDDASFGGVRGGTQFLPLPDVLPKVEGKQFWFGFPKLHINSCGCGEKFYRPMLSLLVEENGVYHQDLLVPFVDFDMTIPNWEEDGTKCDSINILSPNSIAYWEILDQNKEDSSIADYLALSVSTSDSNSQIIILKGVANYILGVYKKMDIKDTFDVSKESDSIIKQSLNCVIDNAKGECKAYGLLHGESAQETSKKSTPLENKKIR